MGILLGLCAALAWGVGDFFAARLSRLAGTRVAPLYTQTLGVGVSTLLVILLAGKIPTADWRAWLELAALGVVHAVATVLFYRALEIGKVSITMPITSSFAVVTGVLALLSGERPARLAMLGAVISLAGLLFVTAGHSGESVEAELSNDVRTRAPSPSRGVIEAIGAALCFGITFWRLDFLEPQFGAPWLLLGLRVVTLPILGALFFASRAAPSTLIAKKEKGVLWLCAIAVITCDTAAWLAVAYGRRSEDVSVVTTLASLYSAVTVCLAWLLWRERLQKWQWLGVAAILAGVVLVGLS